MAEHRATAGELVAEKAADPFRQRRVEHPQESRYAAGFRAIVVQLGRVADDDMAEVVRAVSAEVWREEDEQERGATS